MRRLILAALLPSLLSANLIAQEDPPAPRPVRGSLVEDRAARQLIQAGDARYDVDETKKAIEIWQSVIERYPRSRVRYEAHMRLGTYFLDRDRAFDRARVQFESVASEENRDEQQRAEATVKMGICYYHARNYGKCFQVMRSVIENFPVSDQVNEAYYHIGLGHFQLGHYSRAISALEKVGTALSDKDEKVEKLQAGKRLFIRIEDADLAVLDPGEALKVICESSSGDVEEVECFPVGRNVRLVLGSIHTRLGKPNNGNGKLEVTGTDQVKVIYVDQHTAEKKINRRVLREVTVVANAHVQITDGAFQETLRGVVLGKGVNIQINDADRDVSDDVDSLAAVIEVYRPKTDDEIDAEKAELAAAQDDAEPTEEPDDPAADLDEDLEPKIDPLKLVDRAQITLTEIKPQPVVSNLPAVKAPEPSEDADAGEAPVEAQPAEEDKSVHSGIFRAVVSLQNSEKITAGDAILQAQAGDFVRLVYLDERHLGEGVNQVMAQARALEGNIGSVRVTRAVISDEELRLKTQLKTASALTNIGNRYKEFGLKENANRKYGEALKVCEEIMGEARKSGGRVLEETYVQLWHIYFEMDRLQLAAAMCERLQKEFPGSGFVDDALLQLADVARAQGELNRAIGVYNRLVTMETSQLRGEAQFGIAACYDQMADAAEGAAADQLRDRAFQEYKKVFDQFFDSGRVGEAVAKMASHYYDQKDYGRAVDTFESVLLNHPDAKFLDVILFNYGRCLYRMERKREARQKFDQLIGEFPESALASDAKKISDALAKAGF